VPVILARERSRLDSALEELRALDPRARAYPCDVKIQDALEGVAREIQEEFGGIDLLILNAGVVHVGLVDTSPDPDTMKAVLDTDLWGTILSARTLLPLMGTGGRILCIASAIGFAGAAGYGAYSAAKAGVMSFASALRRELLHRGITVQVACPGDIDTPGYREELSMMPEWMRDSWLRGEPFPVDKAAALIWKKAANGRFRILIDWEVAALLFLRRLIPYRLDNAILDRLLPKPK
jgi:NAD(P)-dependent dehydrogenase (short-subunit alcohol dehydrogenase family)